MKGVKILSLSLNKVMCFLYIFGKVMKSSDAISIYIGKFINIQDRKASCES